MTLLLDQLDLLSAPPDQPVGVPLRISLDAIDEDPDQPRKEFDADRLHELASSVEEFGVIQPISVRRHPDIGDRWMLNFGARRLRASRMAGRPDIPAFVDNMPGSYMQVIENEQREALKPLELALFVQRRLALGESQAEIARRMGKSRQYVTMLAALIDAPDWLITAHRDGRCRGLNELYELRKLAGEHPQHVEAWAAGRAAIGREAVSTLRATLFERPEVHGQVSPASVEAGPTGEEATTSTTLQMPERASKPGVTMHRPTKQKLKLLAVLDGVTVMVETQVAPPGPGQIFVRAVDGPEAEAVEASRLTLTGLVQA